MIFLLFQFIISIDSLPAGMLSKSQNQLVLWESILGGETI